MALHRAEQIMVAVKTKLTNLTSTRGRIYRGRVYDVEADSLPCLLLFQQNEEPINPLGFDNTAYQDNNLNLSVVCIAKATKDLETELNALKKEVHIALAADRTQGLSFVMNTIPNGSSEPELDSEGDQPIGSVEMRYQIQYRHSVNDPSA